MPGSGPLASLGVGDQSVIFLGLGSGAQMVHLAIQISESGRAHTRTVSSVSDPFRPLRWSCMDSVLDHTVQYIFQAAIIS